MYVLCLLIGWQKTSFLLSATQITLFDRVANRLFFFLSLSLSLSRFPFLCLLCSFSSSLRCHWQMYLFNTKKITKEQSWGKHHISREEKKTNEEKNNPLFYVFLSVWLCQRWFHRGNQFVSTKKMRKTETQQSNWSYSTWSSLRSTCWSVEKNNQSSLTYRQTTQFIERKQFFFRDVWLADEKKKIFRRHRQPEETRDFSWEKIFDPR